MAVRCWCLKFQLSDHMFLHKSHVFSNISKILSRSDEGWGAPVVDPSSKPAVSGFVGARGGSVGGGGVSRNTQTVKDDFQQSNFVD